MVDLVAEELGVQHAAGPGALSSGGRAPLAAADAAAEPVCGELTLQEFIWAAPDVRMRALEATALALRAAGPVPPEGRCGAAR